jgi:hypothetical protein
MMPAVVWTDDGLGERVRIPFRHPVVLGVLGTSLRDPRHGEMTLHEWMHNPAQTRRGSVLVVGTSVIAWIALCSGCSSSTSPVGSTSLPSPSLTQEQQDDQAFESLLAGFLQVPFEGESEDQLQPFLTGDALDDEMREIGQYRDAQQHVVGKDTYFAFRVTSRGPGFMVGQACVDASGTRVLDAAGRDVTAARNPVTSIQLKAVANARDGAWRISDLVPNDEVHACG